MCILTTTPSFQELEIVGPLSYAQNTNWVLLEVHWFFQTSHIPFAAWVLHTHWEVRTSRNFTHPYLRLHIHFVSYGIVVLKPSYELALPEGVYWNSKNSLSDFFFFWEIETAFDGEWELPSAGPVSKCPQWPQPNTRAWNSVEVSPTGVTETLSYHHCIAGSAL